MSDWDPGEVLLEKSAAEFELDDLIPYCQKMARMVLGHPIPFERRDRSLFRRLITLYGQKGAGLLLKRIFNHYGGHIDGVPFTTARLSAPWKYWTDRVYHEALAELVPEQENEYLLTGLMNG
jgi:hypothetical protein